jgi:hypothetical protein
MTAALDVLTTFFLRNLDMISASSDRPLVSSNRVAGMPRQANHCNFNVLRLPLFSTRISISDFVYCIRAGPPGVELAGINDVIINRAARAAT